MRRRASGDESGLLVLLPLRFENRPTSTSRWANRATSAAATLEGESGTQQLNGTAASRMRAALTQGTEETGVCVLSFRVQVGAHAGSCAFEVISIADKTLSAWTAVPTSAPTAKPNSIAPTSSPNSEAPTASPTVTGETYEPTAAPILSAITGSPTEAPTASPSFRPTAAPSITPPSASPTATLSPTSSPSLSLSPRPAWSATHAYSSGLSSLQEIYVVPPPYATLRLVATLTAADDAAQVPTCSWVKPTLRCGSAETKLDLSPDSGPWYHVGIASANAADLTLSPLGAVGTVAAANSMNDVLITPTDTATGVNKRFTVDVDFGPRSPLRQFALNDAATRPIATVHSKGQVCCAATVVASAAGDDVRLGLEGPTTKAEADALSFTALTLPSWDAGAAPPALLGSTAGIDAPLLGWWRADEGVTEVVADEAAGLDVVLLDSSGNRHHAARGAPCSPILRDGAPLSNVDLGACAQASGRKRIEVGRMLYGRR
jgi:hypothetical protein